MYRDAIYQSRKHRGIESLGLKVIRGFKNTQEKVYIKQLDIQVWFSVQEAGLKKSLKKYLADT